MNLFVNFMNLTVTYINIIFFFSSFESPWYSKSLQTKCK